MVVAVAVPLAAPTQTSAASGLVLTIPAGTTDNVYSGLNTYFIPTLMGTVFQNQMIQIGMILAALAVAWAIVMYVVRRYSHPGR